MHRTQDNYHILTELQVAHSQALCLLENLKNEVKIKVGLAGGKEVNLEKTELVPDLQKLRYFIDIIHVAQTAIDCKHTIPLNAPKSTFLNMRNLIMVLKEIRMELKKYKLGLVDIRKIYEEELPNLEAAIRIGAGTQQHQFQKLSACRNMLRQINGELTPVNEKLNVLEVVTNY